MAGRRYAESTWTSGLERATASSSSTEAWESRVDQSGRLFYVETPPEPNWEDLQLVLPIEQRRGANLGRKAGLAERLLGLRLDRNGAIESVLSDSDNLVREGDVIHRVEGIPVQDRAGVEMTLLGIPTGAQTVTVHILRRSLKVEEVEQVPTKQPPDFPHLLIYFQPGAREAYKFPDSPAASISGAFPTLYDALDNSFNSGASSTAITYEQQLHSVSYAQLAPGGLLCVAVSAEVVPLQLIRPVVDQLRITVAAEFGTSDQFDRAIVEHRDQLDAFFNRFFHSLRSSEAATAHSRALSVPRLSRVPDVIRVKLDTVLYRFEACELEDGAFVRTHHVLGSAVFVEDSVVRSHFQRPHLEIVFLLLRQEGIFNRGEIARLIVWRPIYLPAADERATNQQRGLGGGGGNDTAREGATAASCNYFLLVVGRGSYVLASLLEVNQFCVNDGNPAPDPYLADWADENLTILRNVLVNVSPLTLKDYLIVDDERGFFVADRASEHDSDLWTLLWRRRLSDCIMVKAKSGGFIACQTIDGVVVVNRQDQPLYTVENALKALRSIAF